LNKKFTHPNLALTNACIGRGDTRMKKIFALTLIIVLALSFSTAGALAAPKEPTHIVCDQMISIDIASDDPHWSGPLTGCELEGATAEYWETSQNYIAGKTEHFFEIIKITTPEGVIEGYDVGVWNFSTFKFRAEGRITSATGRWAYMVGYKFHEIGTTTEVPPPEGITVIYGPSTMSIIGP
jgi:hypothetical protein